MAKMYQMPVDAIVNEGEDMTEQEHKDSCDINKMIRNLDRGIEVRGSKNSTYGYDDTTMSGLDYRIQKANLEEDLAKTAQEHEFTDEELAYMPEKVAEKFKFKKKADKKPDAKNDDLNDEKGVGKTAEKAEKAEKTATPPKTTNE